MHEEESVDEPIIASSSRETESVSTVPCAICRRQFSRYTCPRCNIPYCSLVCFRSEKHADCSESFYKKEVELDVKSAPSANAEEKQRMLELLKRFEEDSLDDSPLLGDSDNEEDESVDLQRRLQHIDLDSASYDELWDALTPAEREKFLRAVNDPESELAKQLLASEELEREQIEPWWEAVADVEADAHINPPATPSPRKHGSKPPIMHIPEPLVKQSARAVASGTVLLYNICALCIAYAYAVRHFAVSPLSSLPPTDPDRAEIRRSISQLVPFLTDRKSTTVHTSLSGVVTDLWSRFPPAHMDHQFFSLLLRDTAYLLRPASVTILAPNVSPVNLEDHPSANALRFLSDVASIFSEPLHGPGAPDGGVSLSNPGKPNYVLHKLTFYAAHLFGTPVPMLRVLADEATMRSKMLEKEGQRGQTDYKVVKRVVNGGGPTGASTASIEELS